MWKPRFRRARARAWNDEDETPPSRAERVGETCTVLIFGLDPHTISVRVGEIARETIFFFSKKRVFARRARIRRDFPSRVEGSCTSSMASREGRGPFANAIGIAAGITLGGVIVKVRQRSRPASRLSRFASRLRFTNEHRAIPPSLASRRASHLADPRTRRPPRGANDRRKCTSPLHSRLPRAFLSLSSPREGKPWT